MIKIVKVESKKQLKAFIRLPWKIYKDDPHWVPPLLMDLKERFHHKFSFYEIGTQENYLAYKNDELVGRISAIENREFNKEHNDKTGFFGYFECIDDQEVANQLLDTVKAWLTKRGLNKMHGPASPSSNHDYGCLVEGFDDRPKMLMPHNPPYYQNLFRTYGFDKCMGLLAYKLNAEDVLKNEKLIRVSKMVKERYNFTIRPINMKDLKTEVGHIRRIYNAAWEKNYGFVPMTEKEIKEYEKAVKMIAEPSLILFGEINGEVVGMVLALLDYFHVFKQMDGRLFPFNFLKMYTKKKEIDWLRVMLLGILPEHRRKGLDSVFYHELIKNGLELGLKYGEASWILEDNAMMNRGLKVVNGEVYKTYHVFEMPI